MSIHGENLRKLCASHHVSEADSRYYSEKSYFELRQKIHWPTFMSNFSVVYRVSVPGGFPIGQFYFFKLRDMDSSPHSFMARYDKRLGICMK